MKIFKRTVSLFLAFCLCAGMLLLQPQSTVSAAVRNKPTTTVLRMSSNSFDSSAIYVNLPKAKVCYIKNIKTSSKNLIAKNTHYYTTSSELSSGKVTVYVKNDLPVKSVKFAGKEVVKTMKNNSTLKLGEYAYIFDNSYSSGRNYSTSLAARTKITITYIDKYTKQECESIYSISRLAK